MPGLTENVPIHAIWHLRGSVDENAGFFHSLMLSDLFDTIGVLYSSIYIGSNL